MNRNAPLFEYLVLSRGQWNPRLSKQQIQQAIDAFYTWHAALVDEGRMRSGQRLAREGKVVFNDTIRDGPFTEAKEIIGGYWFILAESLAEAADIAAGNPCLACGLYFEIRPIEAVAASAFALTSETPGEP